MNACGVCGGSLAGKRCDARFCSDRCRQEHQRGKGTSFRPLRVSIEVTAADRDWLVDEGRLREWDEADAEAIRAAFRSMIEDLRDSS
jgi:hypothetical protein